MRITLNELENLLKDMKEMEVTELNMDISYCNDHYYVDTIDFDCWKNNTFVKTLLTLEDD